jgi:hypothetical protein
MYNARIHTARETQGKLDISRFKRTPQPPHHSDIDIEGQTGAL